MNLKKDIYCEIAVGGLNYFRSHVLGWAKEYGRDFPWRSETASGYEKIVVEVLLQRTRAEKVRMFYPAFLSQFPSWEFLANASTGEIEEALKPLGLWKQRAPRLAGLAGAITSRNNTWPLDREELESLPGVGQYIANAVLLFIHGQARPLMDASMARLLRRFFGMAVLKVDIRYDGELHALANNILSKGDATWLNWGMLDIAAIYCKPKAPNCLACPLKQECSYLEKTALPPNKSIRK